MLPSTKTAQEEHDSEEIGPASLSYSDVDQSGNGIYGRQISDRFHTAVEKIKKSAPPGTTGILKIATCIDQSGYVLMARPDVANTTMNDMSLQRKIGKALIDEKFDADPNAPQRQCGVVVVEF